MKTMWGILKETFSEWNKHEAPRMGAALAFYTILSLAPLLILMISIASTVLGEKAAHEQIASQIQRYVGPEGGKAIETLILSAHRRSEVWATIISLIVLFFGASGVFVELRSDLNKMWNVTPKTSSAIGGMIRERLFSFLMVLAAGILILLSLLTSAAVTAVGKYFAGSVLLLRWVDILVSFVILTVLFAVIFKYVPEFRIEWKDVWVGAITTAVLFNIGKWLIGLYLGKAGVGSPYGAAGSLVAMVVWVYYSAQIFFFGAEFTRVYALRTSHQMKPRKAA